jgi:hypothetical protein
MQRTTELRTQDQQLSDAIIEKQLHKQQHAAVMDRCAMYAQHAKLLMETNHTDRGVENQAV